MISNFDIFDIGTNFSDHTSNLKKLRNMFFKSYGRNICLRLWRGNVLTLQWHQLAQPHHLERLE